MELYCTNERNVQILIYLLKANGIHKVITSPGSAIMTFAASVQHDDFFEVYSSIDERSAAFMACGLATESGEPVVLACTDSTASRNYFPGLTEAYYRKLPIIAVTATVDPRNGGHLFPQYIDQSKIPNDIAVSSYLLQAIRDEVDEWDCNVKVNRALIDLKRNGGGPVHLELVTGFSGDFSVDPIPETRMIKYYDTFSELPKLDADRIAIIVGTHKKWGEELFWAVDAFCSQNNAVVFCDCTSGYYGKYRVNATIVSAQESFDSLIYDVDLLIHIGEHTGERFTSDRFRKVKRVWRVSEDGQIRDTYHKLEAVFDMPEAAFFRHYTRNENTSENTYLAECKSEIANVASTMPNLPFSNIWIAQQMSSKIPKGSFVYFGPSNTIRSWAYFDLPEGVESAGNVGTRGIDGIVSSALGASLGNKDRLYFTILGDLTFFYDMNALGNRFLGNNFRIMVINNGGGALFKTYSHVANRSLGQTADSYVAGCGHYGNKSDTLLKNYSEALGFRYLFASTKEEFNASINVFLDPAKTDCPIMLEVFTDMIEESDAVKAMRNIKTGAFNYTKSAAKDIAKKVLGNGGVKKIRKFLGEK